jgi:hypothetical protein
LEISASQRIVVDSVVQTDRYWFGLRFLIAVDGVYAIFPEIEFSKSWIGGGLPSEDYLEF